MEVLLALAVIGTLIGVPLAYAVLHDRRRERADAVAADIRAAVRRRLRGDSMLAVHVTPDTLVRPGRVVLSTPTDYEYLLEAVWSAVAPRVPPGYELVVPRARVSAPEPIEGGLRRAA